MTKLNLFDSVVDEETRIEYEKEGKNCISLKTFSEFLNANKNNDIEFNIATLGGNLATAITIYDLIKSHPKHTKANIIGLTASAGTVIASACDEIEMKGSTLYLIHNGWNKEMSGNAYDFQQAAASLMKTDNIMVKIYQERTGLPEEKIRALMRASDWMTAYEAQEYGFIDRVIDNGVKIAASVLISEAQGKINQLLLTKLQEKMKIFGKEKAKAEILNTLALKDGGQLLINAEVAASGVEVAPLGAMTLEDGVFELADGRKISVAGGVITEVMEAQPKQPEANEAILGTVAEMLVASEAKISAMIEAKLKPLEAMASTHQPPKGKGPVSPSQASVEDQLMAKVEAKKAEIAEAANKKRKGV